VWFASAADSDQIVCPNEGLIWAKEFTLLGINFDNKLEKMDHNYFEKMNDIEKLLYRWLYRHMSPYGKIVVIKSLALSKLSHIALVVPNLAKNHLQKLEKFCSHFYGLTKLPKYLNWTVTNP
jgi:hypothetical protein